MSSRESESDIYKRFVDFFVKHHLVPILFTFAKGADSFDMMVTAFVLSVGDHWFLVTAGHCLQEVERLIEECEYRIARCRFVDALGLKPEHLDTIPVGWKRLQKVYVSEGYFDYGIIRLSSYYRGLLERNSIQALSEEMWKIPPNEFDSYKLIGVPSRLVKVDPESLRIEPMVYHVYPIDKESSGFDETDAPLFYGRVVIGDMVDSIKGVSGGPIFAFQLTEEKELRYWLVAIQSRWRNVSHNIAAPLARPLGDAIEKMLQERGV